MIKAVGKSNFNKDDNYVKLKIISEKLMLKIEELFIRFGLVLNEDDQKYVGSCPIHGGDNHTAFNLNYSGEYVGRWVCWTHHCEEIFQSSTIGFVRGVLSHQEYNWNKEGDKTVTFPETLKFIDKLFNGEIDFSEADPEEVNKENFVNQINSVYNRERASLTNIVTRSMIKSSLSIPASYYVKRGYSKTILENYDVGTCVRPDKLMYNRIVVPVYDDTHQYMIGCTGRSVFNKCDKCGKWHPLGDCPEEKKYYPKWLHFPKGFKINQHLYNFWNAKKHIKKSHVAILVESPGNVWRLEEAGIHNSVGLFGDSLSDGQRAILDSSGALALILIMDNDENKAGQKAATRITKKCNSIYNVHKVDIEQEDVGEMTVGQIQEKISPIIRKVESEYSIF